jgi:hypothetical protein
MRTKDEEYYIVESKPRRLTESCTLLTLYGDIVGKQSGISL